MGPNTPQFLQSPSNDGDNELSTSSVTTTKSLLHIKTHDLHSTTFNQNSEQTIPADLTFHDDTDCSIVADKNSTTFEIQDFPQYVCPPPMVPANIHYNSECMCPQIANYITSGAPQMQCVGGFQKEGKKVGRHRNFLCNIFRNLTSSLTEKGYDFSSGKCEYYTMNIKESLHDNSPPKRLVFDLVGDVPRNNCKLDDDFNEQFIPKTIGSSKTKDLKNLNNEQLTKETQHSETLLAHRDSVQTFDKASRKLNPKSFYPDSHATRVDVYYFDRGDNNFLKTTDSPPLVTTESLAEKTEAYTTRFWAEIFGTIHIGVSFGISFVLQLIRFLLYSLFRPLTVGIVQLVTDYFLKPCIATLFNAIIQPPLTFLFNFCSSLRDVCQPVAEGMGYFLREVTHVVRAFRIVDIRRERIVDHVTTKEKDKVAEKNELGT